MSCRKKPFLELWEHYGGQRKSEPQEADQMIHDTPMVDAEDQG